MIKSINPDIAIDKVDYIRSESNKDFDRLSWLYSASSNSRVHSGPNRERPIDNASVNYMAFRYRQISVSPELLALRQWQNLANTGSLSMYIIGTLEKLRDKSGFEPTRQVFQFHKKHEKDFSGLKSAAKVVVMRKAIWLKDPETFSSYCFCSILGFLQAVVFNSTLLGKTGYPCHTKSIKCSGYVLGGPLRCFLSYVFLCA